jgi:hypothetical protein
MGGFLSKGKEPSRVLNLIAGIRLSFLPPCPSIRGLESPIINAPEKATRSQVPTMGFLKNLRLSHLAT